MWRVGRLCSKSRHRVGGETDSEQEADEHSSDAWWGMDRPDRQFAAHRGDGALRAASSPSAVVTTANYDYRIWRLKVNSIFLRTLRITLAATWVALISSAATAQGYGYAQDLGPQPWIAGMPVQCMGIPTVVTPIPDIAMARPGVIMLNPQIFNLPAPLQLFIYAHECAHHIVGANESASDCWAAQMGRQQGWFRREDLVQIRQMFGGSPGDWTHAPGPQRVAHIVACYDGA
jgi:hypothetical protein